MNAFAFLKSLISSEEFQGALTRIINRPHVTWRETFEVSPRDAALRPTLTR